MKLTEIYLSRQNRIQSENLEDFKDGLTIKEIAVVGKARKGIVLSFIETSMEHKCNRTDAFILAKMFDTNETDNFKGKKINLTVINEKVRIAEKTKETKTEKK